MTMMTVRVEGLEALKKRLDGVEPAAQAALEGTLSELQRGHDRAKGLGARSNTMSTEAQTMRAVLTTSLTPPRTVGTAWRKKNIARGRQIFRNKAKKRVQEALNGTLGASA